MRKKSGIKVGVIGIGSMGRHHARVYSILPGTNLTAVCDPDKIRASEAGDQFHATVFTDYHDLLPQVEALTVASPTDTHHEIAAACLKAGKNLLVEKPLAKTAEQAKSLSHLAASKGLVLAVGLIERYNPAFQELCKLLRKEKLLGLHITRFSPFPERIQDTNVIHDMMIHDLDLLSALLPDDKIEGLKAQGKKVKSDKLDQATATFYFKSGIIAKVEADRVFGIKTRKIVATTEHGILEADLLNKRIYIRDLEHHIPSVHHVKKCDQLTAELTDFIKAIKNKCAPQVSAEDACRSQLLAEEVERECS